jgi:hypothetical protein
MLAAYQSIRPSPLLGGLQQNAAQARRFSSTTCSLR